MYVYFQEPYAALNTRKPDSVTEERKEVEQAPPKPTLQNRLHPRIKPLKLSSNPPIGDEQSNVLFVPSNANSWETESDEIIEASEPAINSIEQLPAIEEAADGNYGDLGSLQAFE